MAQATTQPRQLPPKWLYKIVNPVLTVILRSPLHGLMSRRLLLLSFTGRKSGKRYTIPLGYAQTGNRLLITTKSAWSKNLRGGAPVGVRLQGRERTGVADVITEEAEMLEGYRVLLEGSPQLGQIIGVGLDANKQPIREDVARARERGQVIIDVQLQ